jgi:UMF1 family MFS transporter
MIKGKKEIIRGWVFYDWANSVYNLVITAAIFPIFYENVTQNYFLSQNNLSELGDNQRVILDFFGYSISNSALYSYVLSISFLVVAFLSPLLSGIADFTGNKIRFLKFFCYLGSLSCIALYFFNPAHIEFSMIFVFLASIGSWTSLVFYNAYLPEIAEPKDHDKISARGFSMGYFGSMILLVACLVMIKLFSVNARWSFVLVGLWWAGFSQVTYRALPKGHILEKNISKGRIWSGFKELRKVFLEIKKANRIKRYLGAFFFFNTGVQTVMLMATIFAKQAIDDMPDAGLIISILLIQLLAAFGAFLMSKISQCIGNIKTLLLVVFLWICLCISAYFTKHAVQFYFLAAGVGLIMGGIQALSRSTYSKLLPETKDHASYFSFYDVMEKIGIVLGTFFFGFIEYYTQSIRLSVLSIVVFFVFGFVLLTLCLPKENKT